MSGKEGKTGISGWGEPGEALWTSTPFVEVSDQALNEEGLTTGAEPVQTQVK